MEPTAWIQIAMALGAIGAGFLWLRSSLATKSHAEAVQLAETRGERVNDLEEEIARLEGRVAYLEGRIDALSTLKAEEIADAVVARLEAAG